MGDLIELDKHRKDDVGFLKETLSLIRGFSNGSIADGDDLDGKQKFNTSDADFWKRYESGFVTKYNVYNCDRIKTKKFR